MGKSKETVLGDFNLLMITSVAALAVLEFEPVGPL